MLVNKKIGQRKFWSKKFQYQNFLFTNFGQKDFGKRIVKIEFAPKILLSEKICSKNILIQKH